MLRMERVIYIIPTPIGNLEDITLRSIKTLNESDMILAEDTRVSKKILEHYDIKTKLSPYHSFNEHKIVESIIEKIAVGQKISLICDAGTPGISDPGYLLIRECIKRNIDIICLPGATACIPALVKSGFLCFGSLIGSSWYTIFELELVNSIIFSARYLIVTSLSLPILNISDSSWCIIFKIPSKVTSIYEKDLVCSPFP